MTTPILANANACRIPLADESVDCVVTSPPFWSLRRYSGQQERIWGGEKDCRHEWGEATAQDPVPPAKRQCNQCGRLCRTRWVAEDESISWCDNCQLQTEHQGVTTRGGLCVKDTSHTDDWSTRRSRFGYQGFCSKCSAWKGALGLEPDPDQFISNLVEVFREVRRVLKPSGCVFLNIGDGYSSGGRTGHGTRMGHKQQTNRGMCGENDPPRAPQPPGLKPKDLCLIPARLAIALQQDGWYVRSEITWCKVAPMPESCRDRPTSATEKIFLLTKSKHYYYDTEAVRAPAAKSSLARIAQPNFANQTGGPKDYGRGTNANRSARRALENFAKNPGHNLWNYLLLSPEPWKGSHFAVFPTALPDICIRAGSSEHGCCAECGRPWERVTEKGLTVHDGHTESDYPKGSTANRLALLRQAARERGGEYANTTRTVGWEPTCTCSTDEVTPAVVLDPFVGSGSTLIAARRLGRQGIGLDLSFPYLRDQARPRLELDRLADWGTGREAEGELDGLPLFERRGEDR